MAKKYHTQDASIAESYEVIKKWSDERLGRLLKEYLKYSQETDFEGFTKSNEEGARKLLADFIVTTEIGLK
jgi:hypothetical protein